MLQFRPLLFCLANHKIFAIWYHPVIGLGTMGEIKNFKTDNCLVSYRVQLNKKMRHSL